MPNSIFFPQKGTKIPNLLQTAKVKTLRTKIPEEKIRGSVVINKSLDKMLI